MKNFRYPRTSLGKLADSPQEDPLKKLLIITLASLFTLPVMAQSPPAAPSRVELPAPALVARVNGIHTPMKLARVETNVRIVGHLAETHTTMTFFNPNDRVLEGDLYFPLPEGVTVSGYALDIGGQLVAGVVVTKQRAREIFEAEVRKGVDPGLVEWTRGNNFKTRVFPIPAKGSRTIRVSTVSEVVDTGDGASYHLPLSYKDPVGELKLRVEVVKSQEKPIITKGGPKGLSFDKWRDSFVAEAALKNQSIVEDLHIQLPATRKSPIRVMTAENGETYFALRDHVKNPSATTRLAPRKLAIYWDASRSREAAPLKQELAVLSAYLKGLDGNVSVDLVVFRNAAEAPRRFTVPHDIDSLLGTLEDLPYDGGTQLGSLPKIEADLNLVFSDGISNFGLEDPKRLSVPTWVVNASSVANHSLMRHIASRTGGVYLNLQRVTTEQAAGSIGRSVFAFIDAQAVGADIEMIFPGRRVPVTGVFDLAGRLSGAEAKVTLRYGIGERVIHERSFTIQKSEATSGDLLRRYWAQKQVDDLMVFPERNAAVIAEVGMEHSVVTPGTSLLVLETLQQHLEYDVRPPKSRAEMRQAFDENQKEKRQQLARERRSKLDKVLAMWEARVAWWSKTYKYPKDFRFHDDDKSKGAARSEGSAPAATASEPQPAPMMEESRDADGMEDESDALAVKAKPKKKTAGKNGESERTSSIKLSEWNPKTPYVKAIEAKDQAERYAEYLAQRKAFGTSPAFYLDCADVFRKGGDEALALRILSNLAEIELESAPLLRVLAGRLVQLDELDLAIGLLDTVRGLRPEEPQSHRDLALALVRRADKPKADAKKDDYARAMTLFAQVVMGEWARFDEIEVMALTELNDVLPRARKAGLTELPVDKRLIKHLDMDIRIVMSWDADNTDMDLHVIEPSGEEAYYSHNRTTIGGLVSRDFTRGYGPEVYAVRRAMPGQYTIKTKFFGSSAAKLIGAVTLQVDVYTNYGRKNQKRESITLRLTENKEQFVVGEITFGK